MKSDPKTLVSVADTSFQNFYSNTSIKRETAHKLLNLRFIDGDQWLYFNPVSSQIEQIPYDENVPPVTANYMLPFVESIKSRILSLNPRARIVPMTRDWSDWTLSLAYTKFFRGITNNIDFDDILQEIVDVMIICKGVFVRPFWNKEISNGKFKGEVDFEIDSDIMAYIDPLALRSKDIRYIVRFELDSIEHLNKTYSKDYKPDKIESVMGGWYLTVLSELMESNSSMKSNSSNIDINNGKIVKKIYFYDDKDKPKVAIVVDKDLLDVYDIEFFPTYIPYYKNFFSKRGRTPLNSLRQIQREINWALTRIKAESRKVSKMIKDVDVELPDDMSTFDFDSSEIVEYTASRPNLKPEIWYPAPVRTLDLNIFINQWAEAGGQFEASRGQVPTSQASGVLVNSLIDQDETKIGNAKYNLKVGLRKVFNQVKTLIEDNYTEDRTVAYMGRERGWEAIQFKNIKDRLGNFSMDIEIGSALPTTSGAKINAVGSLLRMGVFNDLENPAKRARELMDLSVYDMDIIDSDYDKQNAEIEQLYGDGLIDSVQDYDDHMTHVKVLIEFQKTVDFKKMTDKQKHFIFVHREQHMQYIKAMAKNTAAVGNTPTQAPPQTQVPPQQAGMP